MHFMIQPDPFQLVNVDHGEIQKQLGHLLIHTVLVVELCAVVEASVGLVASSADHEKLSVEATGQMGLVIVNM